MNDMFEFEASPWEMAAERLRPGDSLTAGHFLALVEGEDESAVEEAFQTLEELGIILDISDLPRYSGSGETAVRLRQETQLVKKGSLLDGLEENDPLRLYLEELAAMPAAGDPCLLAADAAAGSESAQTMLVNLSLGRVVELAQEYVGMGVLLLDLIQEGSLGLWQGIMNYSTGDFESHRDWWIRYYMVKTVVEQARSAGVGQKLRQAVEDYRATDERLLVELGRNATMEEIAMELHMTPEEAARIERQLTSARTLAKAQEKAKPEEADQEEDQAVEDTAYFQSRQRIGEMLSGLSEQDAKLLTLRFGLEGGMPLSPEEAGRKLGLTPDEVVAREAAALAQLRKTE